jgi:hypothetical protein
LPIYPFGNSSKLVFLAALLLSDGIDISALSFPFALADRFKKGSFSGTWKKNNLSLSHSSCHHHQLILTRMLVTKMKTDKISKQGIYKCEHQPTAQDQKQD